MPCRGHFRRALLAALIVLPMIGLVDRAPIAKAEDVVVLRPTPSNAHPRPIKGEILDYTGRELRIQLATGRQRSIKPELVERVDTARCAEHESGDRLFAGGEFRAAESKYREAIESNREVRPWVRREILAQIVWCYTNIGQAEQAGQVFLMLIQRDPDTLYFDCIPLAWTDEAPSRELAARAASWLAATDHPVAVLLGASHLLTTDRRAAALQQLRILSEGEQPRVAWLAQTQIWRTETAGSTADQLAAWSRLLDASDEALRAGPYFVLGTALARHDGRKAALALLEVPIMYPRQQRLAAAALLSAGGCLESTGDVGEAARLYREILDQHATSVEKGEAARRLDQIARQ